MSIGLKFVQSLDGSLEGINDAGIETFAGKRLASLAREQTQNSLDARAPGTTGPIEIEYKLLSLAREELPGAEDLAAAIDASIVYWSAANRKHQKTLSILNKAKRTLAKQQISVLRISDRNTTGLLASDKVEEGDWFSLTKASGVSLKGDSSLGSFGIGKNVFWLNSGLRTVFFSTHDMDGKYAFQGVSKLVSHPCFKGKRQIGLTRSIGFYGDMDAFTPIRIKSQIPKQFVVKGTGTDIFVAGFDPFEDWERALIAAFAENFFAAFHSDLLRVRIGQHEISSATIAPIIEDLYADSPKTHQELRDFFECLTSADEVTEIAEDLPHIGRAKLRLKLIEGARKQIAMFRATGMKIYEQGHFRTPLEFAGVCICDDPDGNKFLRRMEPPSHDAWEPERNEDDVSAARDAIRELKSWLRTSVQSLYILDESSSIEIPDLERYLPDDEDDVPLENQKGEAEGDPIVAEERILEGKAKRQSPRISEAAQGDDTGDEGEITDEEGDTGGKRDETGEGGDRGSRGTAPSSAEIETMVPIRIFRDPAKPRRYLVKTELRSPGKYSIYLYALGDDGRSDVVNIQNPTIDSTNGNAAGSLAIKGANSIGPIELSNPGAVSIAFDVSSASPLTFGSKVTRHAD